MPIQEVNSRRTPEQHSADSRKAGIASGKARRERRNFEKSVLAMLDLNSTAIGKKNMKACGEIGRASCRERV